MINPAKIRNIIFDWGGVVINLNLKFTLEKFKKLGLADIEKYFTQSNQVDLFDKLETGKIQSHEFITRLNELFPEPPGEQAILTAWNAMLLDFPAPHAELLLKLKLRYKTFLLSNTNEIHLAFYLSMLENSGFKDMSHYFHKVYYSCRINLRKPNKEIFEYVVNDNNLNPAETLFIDDTLQHVEGARTTGLIAHHLVKPEGILMLLKEF